ENDALARRDALPIGDEELRREVAAAPCPSRGGACVGPSGGSGGPTSSLGREARGWGLDVTHRGRITLRSSRPLPARGSSQPGRTKRKNPVREVSDGVLH